MEIVHFISPDFMALSDEMRIFLFFWIPILLILSLEAVRDSRPVPELESQSLPVGGGRILGGLL